MEEAGALVVAVLCGMLGVTALRFVSDAQERAILMRLFLSAFMVRLLFALILYKTGLIDSLGGADDTGWAGMWGRSRFWETSGPEALTTIYSADKIQGNLGWSYFGSYFYYLLNIQSQMALACLNCFLNSLTVVVIYKMAREVSDQRSSTFVGWVAVFMPSFLIWSALTVKETWLILFEISVFYAVWRCRNLRNPVEVLLCAPLTVLLLALILGLRFYAAEFLIAGVIITLLCGRAQRPLRAAGFGLVTIALLYTMLHAINVVQFDLGSITNARFAEMSAFRANVSDITQSGTGSAVDLDYDTTTTSGAVLQLLVGSIYLMLSPFPWQLGSARQMAALPDVLLWWWLVFVYIVPGARYAWQRRPQLVLSIISFVLPLALFYAFILGNVGLAYRQRAQLLPFLLIVAAAGYEKRQKQNYKRNTVNLGKFERSQFPFPSPQRSFTPKPSSTSNHNAE